VIPIHHLTVTPEGKVKVHYQRYEGHPKAKSMVLNCTLDQFNEAHRKYQAGAMMQSAFPFLNADEREFLINGLLPDEFEALR
jgi:hypothetical protein